MEFTASTKQSQPQTVNEFLKAVRSLHRLTFAEFTALRSHLVANIEQYRAELSAMKKDDLSKFVYLFRSDYKKVEIIEKILDGLKASFYCGKILSYMLSFDGKDAERRKAKEEELFNSATPEVFEAWATERIKEEEKNKKTYTNPETLEEFRAFCYIFGEKKLTPEQLVRYDELRAQDLKEKQAAEPVKRVEAVSGEFTYQETKHTQKGHDLFVCSLNNRVDGDTFKSLSTRAKMFGGYYSSYNKGGAVAGFTFTSADSARKFLDGGSNQQEVDNMTEAKQMSRAETLRAKGDKLIEEGNQELNRDRKDNTHRRARMAANAEAAAERKIRFGQTLVNIGEGLDAGNIQYLDKLTNITELETLYSILSSAHYKETREKNAFREGLPISEETIQYAAYPLPVLYASHTLKTLHALKGAAGRKMAAARMLKRLGKAENITVSTAQGLEDYEILFCTPCAGILDKWEAERYKNNIQDLKRLQRLGITALFMLRAALRELLTLKATTSEETRKAAELKALERSLIGKKIDGFFPTPAELAARLVEEANIQEGNTILEPSAGIGHIAEAIDAAHPDNSLTCVEMVGSLCDILKAKGFDVLNENFLSHSAKYDRIVMNPPFENLQDIDHVRHAFDLLNDGGRLVAVMAANKEGDREKVKEFRAFVEAHGYSYDNEAGAFLSAFRPTAVNTITVILNK